MINPGFAINNWREILQTLSRNKTRTFLTAIGIFWGTFMLALLWGGSHGLEGAMKRNFSSVEENIGGVSASPRTMSYKGFNKGTYWSLNDQDVENIKKSVPHLNTVTAVYYYSSNLAYLDKTASATILGIDDNYFRCSKPVVLSGRWLNSNDFTGDRKTCVLGQNLAASLFGDEDPVGKMISVSGVYVRVVGVVTQRGEASIGGNANESVFMSAPVMRRLYRGGTNVDFIVLIPEKGYTVEQLEPDIRRVIKSNFHYIHPGDNEALDCFDLSEMFEIVDKLFLGITILALVVGAGSLMAGIIGVGNIMWIIVKERTKEIGIRRAIGAKPRDIITQVLCESMFLTTVAGMAGISFSCLILFIAEKVTYDPIMGGCGFVFTLRQGLTILITFLVLGSAAGLLPALKAMNIKPIEALNDK
ncbi:MAG: ABC transporter permease [Paramuribaculum sp.]|nr:ABC transporter permease [Paramuribaculum sp.]